MFTIALPNGSLQEPTLAILEKAGIRVEINGRHCLAKIAGSDLFGQAIFARPQHIPELVAKGTVAAGICGWDCVVEYYPSALDGQPLPFCKIVELAYARTGFTPVRVVVFASRDRGTGYDGRPSSGPLLNSRLARICSEYPRLTQKIYPMAEITHSYGCTEAMVFAGLYNYGVGVAETGKTIGLHELEIVDTLFPSPVVLLAKQRTQNIVFFGEQLAVHANRFSK